MARVIYPSREGDPKFPETPCPRCKTGQLVFGRFDEGKDPLLAICLACPLILDASNGPPLVWKKGEELDRVYR